MEYVQQVAINRFVILDLKPNNWLILVNGSWLIQKGDTLKVVEVDSLGIPTGRYIVSDVLRVQISDLFIVPNDLLMVYCVKQ